MKKLFFSIQIILLFLAFADVSSQWFPQNSGTTNDLNNVFFTDANNGTAVGENGTIRKTTNGGTNWTTQTTGSTSDLYGLSFINANTGTIVGYGGNGMIFRTTNGGINWTIQISGTPHWLHGVSFTDANTGTVVGNTNSSNNIHRFPIGSGIAHRLSPV